MNNYEITLHRNHIQVQASTARIALNRALRRLTDSQFLDTTITIRFRGKVGPKTPQTWSDRFTTTTLPEGCQ